MLDVIEPVDRVDEERPAPGPAGQPFEPHPAQHQPARRQPRNHPAHRSPRAEREAAQVVVSLAQVRDQRRQVLGQTIARIGGGIVRRGALPVGAQIWHQAFEPGIGQQVQVPPLDPVGLGTGKQPVEHDQRAPGTQPVQRQPRTVEAGIEFGPQAHSGTSSPASFQRSATLLVVAL